MLIDGDGYGDADSSVDDCAQPVGYVTDSSDCDDQDNDVYPQAQEFCNNEDDDCDGTIDESDALFHHLTKIWMVMATEMICKYWNVRNLLDM